MIKATVKASRMTPKKWADAETLWESGDVTLEDLSKKYGITRQTLSRKFKKSGSVKSASVEETKKAVAAEIVKTSIDEASITLARVKDTKEKHYKMSSMIAQLTWQEILQAKNAGAPVASALNNLKALDTAMTVLKKSREECWILLGLDKVDEDGGDDLPELVISHLTAEEIKELRDSDLEYMDDVMQKGSLDDVVEE